MTAPHFNRAAQREALKKTGQAYGQKGGNYYRLSPEPGGRYMFRVMPKHPTKNPDYLVLRPTHWWDAKRYPCNRFAPPAAESKVGKECCFCDFLEYMAPFAEDSFNFSNMVPNEELRKRIVELPANPDTYCYMLLLERAGVPVSPPRPITFQSSTMTIIKMLDDEGLGRQPYPQMAEMLTDPAQGRNFIVVKKDQKHYETPHWDPFPTPVTQFGVTPDMMSRLLSTEYPNLWDTNLDDFKPYADMEKILRDAGLM